MQIYNVNGAYGPAARRHIRIVETAVQVRLGPMNNKELGALGEKVATSYLKNKGYKILDQNYFSKFAFSPLRGEIDIVAKKEDIIIFIEVKALINNKQNLTLPVAPEEKVNFWKQKKIIKIAESWLMKNKISFNSKWQIDVISIIFDFDNKKAKIRHFKNIIF